MERKWRYERDQPNGNHALWSRVWGPTVTVQCPGGDLDHAEPDMLLIAAAPELLEALEGLQRELRQHIRFNVKKHYSLMVYDAAATKAIAKAKGVAAVGYTNE